MALNKVNTLVKVLMLQGEKGEKGDAGEISNLNELLDQLEDVVYTKTEIDNTFLTEQEIIDNFYTKAQTYDKTNIYTQSEVDALLQTLEDSISDLITSNIYYKAGDTITIPNDTAGRIRCAGYISESGKHLRVTVPTKPIDGDTITINNLYVSARIVSGGYAYVQGDSGDSVETQLGSYGQQLIDNGSIVLDVEDYENDYITGISAYLTNGQMTLVMRFKYALRNADGGLVTNNTPVAFDIAGDFIVS